MCGRYSQTRAQANLIPRFRIAAIGGEVRPRYNICPSQPAPVIFYDGDRSLDLFRWGLIPSWAKDPKISYKMINARAETVPEKPAFRRPFQKNRCLVVADGFYEWKGEPKARDRTPMWIHLASKDTFAMAGLWDTWRDAEGRETRTFTILTCAPNDLMASIHNRMPVILRPEDEDVWLDPTTQPATLQRLLGPYTASEMAAYAVSPLVNSPRNDTPDCLAPAESL